MNQLGQIVEKMGSVILLYLLIQLIYSGYYFNKARILSKTIYTGELELGDKLNPPLKIFVDGDSIAAGVGATSFENSASGRLANFLATGNHLLFSNMATPGRKMADLLTKQGPSEKQDLTVIIIASNDLFRFTNLQEFARSTENVLKKYSKMTDKLILLGPGRVSTAPAIPIPLRLIYKIQEPKYVSIISQKADKYPNVIYIKPGTPLRGTFAPDKFHPNDEGHKVWFEAIKTAIEKD